MKGRSIDARALDGEEGTSMELVETRDGSLHSTEPQGCPRSQLPAKLRAAAPRGDPARLFSCAPFGHSVMLGCVVS